MEILPALVLFLGAFLLASLVTAPFRVRAVTSRLVSAFVAWGGLMLLIAIGRSTEITSLWPVCLDCDGVYMQPYAGTLGAFLGAGARFWSLSWWKSPLDFRHDFAFRLASRISFRSQRSISGLVVRLGILSITVGLAVMMVAVSIVFGFERAIQDKVVGFGAHIRIGNLLEELESEVVPLPSQNEFVPAIRAMEDVKGVYPYVQKSAMLRSATTQEGVMVKGVDSSYNWSFFEDALVAGKIPDVTQGSRFSPELLISQRLAQTVDTKLGDKVFLYFFEPSEGKARVREFKVTGIYETGLGEFDQTNVLCDIRVPQSIWRWDSSEVMGFEVMLEGKNLIEKLPERAAEIEDMMPYTYEANTITSEYPELFEWVALQHQNVWFILLLMVLIAVINMMSVILILVIERTRTIGLLKALGMPTGQIVEVFVSNAMFLVLIGLALGNLAGLGLIATQDWWGWLQVDQESYFVRVVPVMWTWDWFLHINFGVLAVCTIVMYLPSLMVAKVSVVKALRFE